MAAAAHIVREMVDEVIEFTRCYTLWRELMDPSNHSARMNHQDFLLTVSISTLSSFCVRTFQLFDKDPQTKSLRRLIEDIRPSDPHLAQQLDSAVAAQQPLLTKVFRLRHNVYAHRNKSRQPRDFFADVKLTPRAMKEVVQLAQRVACAIAVGAGVGKKDAFEKQFRDNEQFVLTDTHEVLRVLGD